MALFYLDNKQMNFMKTIIEIQIEDIISDLEQEEEITIKYLKDDLETIASNLRHFDNSDQYGSIEEGIRDVLL